MSYVKRWYVGNAFGNYNHLAISQDGKRAVVFDPFNPRQTIEKIKKFNLELQAVLVTHAHADHYCGAKSVAETMGADIYSHASNRKDLPKLDVEVQEGDKLTFGDDIELEVIESPGHIAGHVCFYNAYDRYIICGDTLFNAGVGNTKSPSADVNDLFSSIKKLSTLPDDTVIYPSHDYFKTNLKFTLSIVPNNRHAHNTLEVIQNQTPDKRSVSTIGEEKKHNLFLQSNQQAIADRLSQHLEIDIHPGFSAFATLRQLRDEW